MERHIICTACGTKYFPPRETCPICEDDRQFVPEGGQTWTTEDELGRTHQVRVRYLLEGVFDLQVTPTFAIGQRTFLLRSPGGNILWDCIPLLDQNVVDFVRGQGGLKAVAFSHPHYYSNMDDWAETFGCPIYIHESDGSWVFRKGKRVVLWKGEDQALWDGIRILRVGGHFPGSCVLHVPSLSPQGSVFCGDTLAIAPSKEHVAVMYSYPNRIPLPVEEVRRIRGRLEGIPFDALYGFYPDQNLSRGVKALLEASFERYLG